MRGFFHHSNTSKKLHQLVTEFCRVASDVCHPFTSLKFVRSSVPLFTHSTSFRQQPCPKKTSLPSSVGMNVFSKNPFSLKLFKKRTFLSIPLWSVPYWNGSSTNWMSGSCTLFPWSELRCTRRQVETEMDFLLKETRGKVKSIGVVTEAMRTTRCVRCTAI